MSALVTSGLSREFGGVQALSGVSLSIESGERRIIIGPNGAGKTTLFNVISGAIASSSGTIVLFGADITKMPAHARARRGLARTFQITNLFPKLTVRENVCLALLASDRAAIDPIRSMRSKRDIFDRADAAIEKWSLSTVREKLANEISYGEQRQVDLMLATAVQPKILLLDEPMAGLSASEVVRVVGMIRSLPKEITVLMIEHDMDVAFELADRISVLHQGRLIAEGEVDAIRNNQLVAEIYLGND